MHFKKRFSWRSNLSNENIISTRPGMKMGVKSAIFWSEIGAGFQELCSASSSRIPRSNAPPLPSGKTDALDMHKAEGYHQSFNFFDKSLIL